MSKIKTQVVISTSVNPAFNLSFEEWLFNNLEDDTVTMFLWQNENTIVIGRNQNPWKECRLDLMKNEQVKLVRRSSGGGTVYHDLGNLNFTFMANERIYDVERQTGIITRALRNLKIEAELNDRNDLLLKGRKFSGTAYKNVRSKSLHHGTLLVDSNLDLLERYLGKPKLKIDSRGVDSVRSKVINLKEMNADLSIDALVDELAGVFMHEYEHDCPVKHYDEDQIRELVSKEKYDSWKWNFSESPAFSIQFASSFKWGETTFEYKIKNGVILECAISSHGLDSDEMHNLSQLLVGTEFRGTEIAQRFEELNVCSSVIDALRDYVILHI